MAATPRRSAKAWWTERHVRDPGFQVDWAAVESNYAFAAGTPRCGGLTPAFAKWLAKPRSAPSKDPGQRDSSLWWSADRTSAPTWWSKRAAHNAVDRRLQDQVPELVAGPFSTSSADVPSSERVRQWKLEHVQASGIKPGARRAKGIGSCNPLFKNQVQDAKAQEAVHVHDARARSSHEVTRRPTTPPVSTPRSSTPRRQKDEVDHICRATIPGYTGSIPGQEFVLGKSQWNSHFVPDRSGVRGCAPPQTDSEREAFQRAAPSWLHASKTAILTPRRQWQSDVHAHESSALTAWQVRPGEGRRIPHGHQRRANNDWANAIALRGQRAEQNTGVIARV